MANKHSDFLTEQVKRRYNRIACLYDLNPMDVSEALRKQVLQNARGQVLEVGVGTGKNLPFYPDNVQVIGVDFSPAMLKKAHLRLEKLGRANVKLMEMDVQHLDFPDNTFDTVISTCVFCTVPNPVAGLAEIRRVMKPTGTLYMLEHMRSSRPVLGLLMDLLDPVFYSFVGTHINRRTFKNLEAAKLRVVDKEAVTGDIVFTIKAEGTS